MALESATYISDLVSTNPTSSDNLSQGDDHLRLLKSTIKATFPNVSGAVLPTHTELNFVDGVTSSIQTQLDAKAPLASPAFTGVASVQAGSAALPALVPTGDTNTGFWFPAADTIAASTAGSERMRISSAGDVGIGTASPNEKFHIRSSGSIYAKIQCDNAGAGAGLYFTNTTTNWLIGAGPVSGAGEFAFYDSTRSAERMRIDASGNVGIGTSSPSTRLHVDSGAVDEVIRANSTGSTYLSLYRSNVREAYLQSTAIGTTLWVDGAKPLYFGTNGSERLRITAAGGVSFGSGGTAYGTSGQVLQSNGDAPPSWTTPAAVTTANVLSATAGASAGAVGTYAFLRFSTLTNATVGTTHAGSGLRYSNANGSSTGGTPSGTWALMGDAGAGSNASSTSLFLRIL